MSHTHIRFRVLAWGLRVLMLVASFGVLASAKAQVGFLSTDVVTGLSSPTSLQFGPDGRLYVSQQNGIIYVYTIQRSAPGAYSVTATETINLVKDGTPNHNDDGSSNTTKTRQVTGLLVMGTSNNPILYVSSSDWRIAVGNDSNLDTNSGIVSRLTWIGSGLGDPNGYWDKVDLVRGLPRSEENHATNGMDYDPATNKLFLAVGGNANKGAPSNNFSATPEYALAAAILEIDLNAINAMPVYTDPRTNTKFVYDLPTLDDPTRPNITNTSASFPYPVGHPYYNESIDLHDPFGGNNGLNQARLIVGGPVQIHGTGFRNPYDVVFTTQGRLYTYDNGPNSGWGGQPKVYDVNGNSKGTGPANPAIGDYVTNEINETSSGGHGDRLHFISSPSYYGGYPNPSRANPLKAGMFTYQKVNGVWNLTGTYDLATDFPNPPVDPSLAHPIEMVYIDPNHPDDQSLDVIGSSVNGITEYTASNFGGAMQGNILTVAFNDNVYSYKLNAAGDAYVTKDILLSGLADNPLDITAQGDNEEFPGTIWIALHGSGKVMCFEPNDFAPFNCSGANDPNMDEDGDGFSNADEIANGTDPCSQGSKPRDYDGDFISNLTDPDDDNDGWLDTYDPFPVDPNNGTTKNLPVDHGFSINNGEAIPGSLFGLGFTGLMTNGNYLTQTPGDNYQTRYFEDTLLLGGAISKFAVQGIPTGTALNGANTQFNGFQFGVNVNVNSAPFTVHSEVESPYFLVNGAPVTPSGDMSAGIFIGNGDQNNYIAVMVHANGGQGGIRIIREVGGVATVNDYGPAVVGNILGSVGTDIYFSVNPATLTVQPRISIDGGGNILNVGPALAIPASWLSATDNVGMAVGVLSTSANSTTPFTATWDFINVRGVNPTSSGMPDRQVFKGADPETVSLDEYFQDDEGVENLIYTIQGNSATYVTAVINGGSLDLTYPASDTDEGDIIIRATDAQGYFVQDTFHVSVRESLVVLYRVNTGGDAIAPTDAPNPGWSADSPSSGSPYRMNGNNVSAASFTNLHASIPSYLPTSVFSTERWDPASGGEMMWNFPAVTPGIYEVRLFLNNSFNGTSLPGQRVFDILVENQIVWDNLDLVVMFGHKTAGMLTYQVNVTDGNLDIDFNRVADNPIINAIEILGPPATSGPANLAASPNPLHFFSTTVGSTSAAQAITLSNSGGSALTISGITMSGTDAAMFAHNGTTPLVIPGGGSVNVNVTFSPTSTGSKTATINFAHNGSNGSPVSVSIDGEAIAANTGPNAVLYRLNNGGPQVAAADGSAPAWAEDRSNVTANGASSLGTPSPFLIAGGEKAFGTGTTITLDPSVPASVPMSLFQTERWDESSGAEMQFGFPVTAGTQVQVRLYLAELYFGGVGNRVFDVRVEGVVPAVFDNIDAIAAKGKNVGYMLSYDVLVTDGTLNIEFLRQAQNPAIKGIEIVSLATGSVLSAAPSSHNFGSVNVGSSSAAQTIVLTNSGPDDITLSGVSLAGANAAEFSLNFSALYSIPAGGSANVSVTFNPTSFGAKTATLQISHDGTNPSPLEIALTGQGLAVGGVLGVSPAALTFPSTVKNNSSVAQTVTLSNTGNAPLTVSASLTGGSFGEFTQSLAAPVVIPANGSTSVNVTFAPTSAGAKTTTLQFVHDGLNTSPATVALDGVGLDSLPSTPTYEVVYRINTGGAALAALDAPNPGWSQDGNGGTASPFRNNSSNVSSASYNTVHASVPASTPLGIFSTERWDTGSAPDMMWNFPISEAGTYEVRLYFLNSFNGTSTVGKRIFDILIEGALVADNFDIVAEFGHKVAAMKSFTVSVNDGNLDIDFGRVLSDPLVNGIEILKVGSGPATPSIAITSPAEGAVISGTSAVIVWNALNLNPTDHFDVVVDGNAISGIEVVQPGNSYTVNGLAPGLHTVRVQIEDMSHTMYPGAFDEVTFTTQIPVPTVNITSPAAGAIITGTEVTMSWTSANLDPLDHFHVSIDNQPHTSVVQPGSSYTFTGLNPGSHTVRIHLADYAHNEYMNAEAMDSVTFTLVEPSNGTVVYRINAGGSALAALDAPNMGWAGDGQGGYASPYRNGGSNVSAASMNSFHSSAPSYTPAGIFAQERWDTGGAPDMMWDFPVANGNYEVHLFFMNNFSGTSTPGKRVFDVLVEGAVVLDNFDIIPTFGHKIAGMVTITTTVTDGNLDIDFGRVIGDPLINGIEILQLAAPEGQAVVGEPGVNNGGSTNNFNRIATSVGPDSPFFGYDLKQNYPNPFTESTMLSFELPEQADVTLTVYNMIGQPVKVFSGTYAPGRHEVEWKADGEEGRRVAAGVYHVVMSTNNGYTNRIKVQVTE